MGDPDDPDDPDGPDGPDGPDDPDGPGPAANIPAPQEHDPADASVSEPADIEPAPAVPDPIEPSDASRADLLAPSNDDASTGRPDDHRNVLGKGDESDATARRYFTSLYRPADNPGRLHVSARAHYAVVGTSEAGGGGRAGGVAASIGQTWNVFGYGLEASFLGGQVRFEQESGGPTVQANILVGGGPVLGLGRLGLVRRSMLDLQIGYNFYYGVTNPVLHGDPSPDAIAPHGPQARFNAGFQLETRHGTSLHQFLGVSAGWQGLVHSFSGAFPLANSFNFGIFYAFL
jgi:hypothetical protein